jgi:hypothetical protein
MIGSRLVLGVVAAVMVGLVFGQRPADPAQADPARGLVVERRVVIEASHAEDALTSLARRLQLALDDARAGSAAVRRGAEQPGPKLTAAAEQLMAARTGVAAARTALERLRGTLRAMPTPAPSPELTLTEGQLTAIAAQLEGSAALADAFAEMRRSTDETLGALERALIGLRDDDPSEALAAVAETDQWLDVVRRWEQALPTMPLWVKTTQTLLDAAADLAQAQLSGDDDAAAAAARAYRAAADEARRADQALAVAFAEGGSAVTATPLQQLAAALALAEETRSAVASLVHRLAAAEGRRSAW